MDKILRLLHPFMPFITEEIWQSLPHEGVSIMLADYPKFSHEFVDANAENSVKSMIDIIKGVRNRRAEMNVVPSKKQICSSPRKMLNYSKIVRCLFRS